LFITKRRKRKRKKGESKGKSVGLRGHAARAHGEEGGENITMLKKK